MTSTADALKNLLDGKPAIESTPLGGPKAPYRQELDAKLLEEARSKKAEYVSLLRVGRWIVEFTKVDGTPSIMECTLDQRLLPMTETANPPTLRPEKPDLLHVFALDRDPPGWRSCKVLNVTRVYAKTESL